MKKNSTNNYIPDIDIIDLEDPGKRECKTSEDFDTKSTPTEKTHKKGWKRLLNTHVLLLLVFLIFVISLVVKFWNWGQRIDIPHSDSTNTDKQYLDVLDQILPLIDDQGNRVETGKADTIVAFGNSPFSDDRDSEDNLANLIAKASGATVYNCSVSGSYLASQNPHFNADTHPMDAYCLYWLVTLATTDGLISDYYKNASKVLGENIPPEAQEVYDLLLSIDFNEVDVITIMYDAADYLMGHAMYDDINATNIQCFTGNLEASIELLQATYPHIRIIVMSPTYAYAVNEDGEYVSSDIFVQNGQDVLSTYVIKEYASCAFRNVTFIDHLYGTITARNARDYLIDNVHLTLDGRKLVAQRFMDALLRYNN